VKDRSAADKVIKEACATTHILRLPPGSVVTFTNLQTSQLEIQSGWKRYKPAVVQDTLLRTALGGFLLLLLVNLWCLRLDLTGTRERSVNCS
jgi:hypothetical protein